MKIMSIKLGMKVYFKGYDGGSCIWTTRPREAREYCESSATIVVSDLLKNFHLKTVEVVK
jgi:hypothetical protein